MGGWGAVVHPPFTFLQSNEKENRELFVSLKNSARSGPDLVHHQRCSTKLFLKNAEVKTIYRYICKDKKVFKQLKLKYLKQKYYKNVSCLRLCSAIIFVCLFSVFNHSCSYFNFLFIPRLSILMILLLSQPIA